MLEKQNRICIIGSGASAIYTLKYLANSPQSLNITVFESHPELGKGRPFLSDMNADYMLCNAFSREIPEVTRSLIDWLEGLPKRELSAWELSMHDLSARAFYPRLLIGEFLADEFLTLCKNLRLSGHKVTLRADEKVVDIAINDDNSMSITSEITHEPAKFEHVVIATGHSWPATPEIDQANLLSPWPYTNVTELPPQNIGILGSSLSAIDIVIALGSTHGEFEEQDGLVTWYPNKNAFNLNITMVSKMGIMPEGDFYYQFSYLPLEFLSEEGVDLEVSRGPNGLLQKLFDLFCRELDLADPKYLDGLGSTSRTLDGFAKAYFRKRQELGAQTALKYDFVKARQSMKERQTIASRYVLLRAHENFDRALRALNEEEWAHFSKTLLPVFADSYAAVPHLSLARVIAMFDAKVLSLKASGDEAVFKNLENGGVKVEVENEIFKFDVMVDARGQASAPLELLPFPSLVKNRSDVKEYLISPFRLKNNSTEHVSIYCLALPQMLERYPFSQGLANSAENGKLVAEQILNLM